MSNPTVAEHIVRRLSDLGVDKAFGVPSDYAFPIADAIEASSDMDWVGCTNELNAAYAADGYARLKGAGLLCAAYGVGELSLVNGLMGSKAHRVPVFFVTGQPSRRITKQRLISKHTLGDGVYGNFEHIIAAACCAKAVISPDNAIDEIERVIREALAQSQPAYMVVLHDAQDVPVIGTPVTGEPLDKVRRQVSVAAELEGAVTAIVDQLKNAHNPVILPTALTARYGLRDKIEQLIEIANIPFALSPMDKGFLGEQSPLYLGLYYGEQSTPEAVKHAVEGADVILDLGGLVEEAENTGYWTDALPEEHVVHIYDNWVRVGTKVFVNLSLEDVIDGLIARAPRFAGRHDPFTYDLMPLVGDDTGPVSSAAFYPRVQRMLQNDDVLVIEAGSGVFVEAAFRLPGQVRSQAMTLWSSIGWGTPATLGMAMAEPETRVILITGDGSHQMTINALADMGHHGAKPVIFVLNNGVYGCEITLHEEGKSYNNLPELNYSEIPRAFGCRGWLTKRVATVKELDEVLDELKAHRNGAYIEVMIPESESVPLPADVLDAMYKLKTPTP
jgi:indolepyruvate decarboxylase